MNKDVKDPIHPPDALLSALPAAFDCQLLILMGKAESKQNQQTLLLGDATDLLIT